MLEEAGVAGAACERRSESQGPDHTEPTAKLKQTKTPAGGWQEGWWH